MRETKVHLWVWSCLVLIVLSASIGHWYSAYQLFSPKTNPRHTLSGDEVAYMALGDRLWKEGKYSTVGLDQQLSLDKTKVVIPAYLQAPLFKHPPLYPFLVGLSRRLFWGIAGASFYPSLLMGAVSLVGLFWLARRLECTPVQSLLAVLLLAASPVHWICSSRIWMDVTLMSFVLLALAAQLSAEKDQRWWVGMGVFWGCALLTKYTALAAWVFVLAGSYLMQPKLRRQRFFWIGHAIAIGLFLPWFFCRFRFEGATVIAFWQSNVEDWKTLARMSRWIWVLPVILALFWAWHKFSSKDRYARWLRGQPILLWGTFLFLLTVVLLRNTFDFCALPWSGWGDNLLKNSSKDFYLTRQVLFEPICWWGLIGLAAVQNNTRWNLIRFAWVGLFIFLTCWGNFQSRYGLPLVPFEHLLAVALLPPLFNAGSSSKAEGLLGKILIIGWFAFSLGRSCWIIQQMAFKNWFFYF